MHQAQAYELERKLREKEAETQQLRAELLALRANSPPDAHPLDLLEPHSGGSGGGSNYVLAPSASHRDGSSSSSVSRRATIPRSKSNIGGPAAMGSRMTV